MHLPLILFFSFQAVTLARISDIWNRDSSHLLSSYTVYPADLGNRIQIKSTEVQLKKLCPDSKIQLEHVYPDDIAWCLTSKQGNLQDALNALDGVRNVELGIQPTKSQQPFVARSELVRRDYRYYLISAKPGSNTQTTKAFLETKVQGGEEIYDFTKDDGTVIGWGHLALDDSVKTDVENYEGMEGPLIEEDDVGERAISAHDETESSQPLLGAFQKVKQLLGRALTWVKQENADWSLVMDSQYRGLDITNEKDFFHAVDPGEHTFIYVIDNGVQLNARNPDGDYEFKSDRLKVLQTRKAKAKYSDPLNDEDPGSHGTGTASKACGRKYGVAKEATVIPVKYVVGDLREFRECIALIMKNIDENLDRKFRSVVVMSRSLAKLPKGPDWRSSPIVVDYFLDPILQLQDLGVPLVLAAGNSRTETGDNELINRLPQILQQEDTPIINIGANDRQGEPAWFSQRGPKLTMYAPGSSVAFLLKNGEQRISSGTSFAAPQYAGLVATYMSYDVSLWDDDLRGRDLVRAIRDYILTEDSSWIRKDGSDVRIIWNGAKEENHKSAGTNINPQAPKALSIIMQNHFLQGPNGPELNDNSWLFFETNKGQSALCHKETDAVLRTPMDKNVDINNPPWPGGTFDVRISNMDCQYKNNGADAGALWCNDKPITCHEENMKAQQTSQNCGGDPGTYRHHPVVYCES